MYKRQDPHDALDNASDGDTVDIYDGTYTVADTMVVSVSNLTIKGNSGNAAAVIIKTTDENRLLDLNRLTSGTTIQDVTLWNDRASGTNYVVYGASGGSSGQQHGIFTMQDCVVKGKEHGFKYVGSGSLIQRTHIHRVPGGSASYIKGIAQTVLMSGMSVVPTPFTVESCLFTDWYKNDIYNLAGSCTIRNCTFIGGTSTSGDGVYLAGNDNAIYNSIVYSNPSDAKDEAFKFNPAHSSNTIKNCISFGGATTDYTNAGSPTVSADLKDNDDVDTDGNDIFVNLAGGSYHPHTDGLAYQNGTSTVTGVDGRGLPSTDLSGSAIDSSSPSIGCYAPESSAWSGGSSVGPTATGGCASVGGTAIGLSLIHI